MSLSWDSFVVVVGFFFGGGGGGSCLRLFGILVLKKINDDRH